MLRPWCRSIFPRRDTPTPGAVVNLQLEPLEFPLRVHVSGRPHGLPVPWAGAGGAGVCDVAPYTWSKGKPSVSHGRFFPFAVRKFGGKKGEKGTCSEVPPVAVGHSEPVFQ